MTLITPAALAAALGSGTPAPTILDVRWDLAAMGAFVLLTFGTSVLLLRVRPDAR